MQSTKCPNCHIELFYESETVMIVCPCGETIELSSNK